MLTKNQIFPRNWANEMFSLPPARQVKGRTRWTHRHGAWITHLNRFSFVESRNELVSLFSLEHLHNKTLIKRFKEQPFTLPAKDFGFEYTPDFAFEDSTGALYVAEIKTQRFVTREIDERLSDIKKILSDMGMHFLLWTDKTPLTKNLRHNILNMRRFSLTKCDSNEKENFLELIRSKKQISVAELFEKNTDLGLIYHSIFKGEIHTDIRQRISLDSVITAQPEFCSKDIYTGACATSDIWWNSLDVA